MSRPRLFLINAVFFIAAAIRLTTGLLFHPLPADGPRQQEVSET